MTSKFLACILGVVCAVVISRDKAQEDFIPSQEVALHAPGRQLVSVEAISCPPISLLTHNATFVSLLAGGEPGFSVLARNVSCAWVIPFTGEMFSIGVSYVRLPPGGSLTVEAFPGEYVLGPNCACDQQESVPVCSYGTTYRNNCTAICEGVAPSDIQFCARTRTALSGDVPIPVTVNSEGGAFIVRYDYFAPPPDVTSRQFVQLGFNFSIIPAGRCFNGCSGHGTCQPTSALNTAECICQDEWKGSDCSMFIPVIRDRGSLTVKSLCPGCWFFAQFFIANTTFIGIEVDSLIDSESDPFVVASRYVTPTISRFDRGQSWVSWTYEDSQLRLVSWDVTSTPQLDGPYYIGVVNHPARAKEVIDFVVTLRLGNATYRPCIHNCSGNGVCSELAPLATCNCSEGSTGVYCEQADSEIKFGQFKQGVLGPLRMGQWAFWHFDVPVSKAFMSTVMVSFQSLSPRAYPFVGVRMGSAPFLDSRFLPTFDAFVVDFADNAGFDLLKGQRQTVVIPAVNLSAGRYYVGVFNLWGRTGLPQTSRSTLNYTLLVESYKAGIPCPMERGTFCGETKPRTKCDLSKGVCKCAIDELGDGCYFKARPLPIHPDMPFQPSRIVVGLADYFYLQVTDASDLNLRVSATLLSGNATLVLLAKKGSQPFDVNFTYYDVRDSESLSQSGNLHTITLSHTALTPGVWYFAVVNSAESSEPLDYTLTAVMAETLDCEHGLSIAGVDKECSGQGTCDSSSGTCTCFPGYTGLDCSALGIPYLGTGGLSSASQSPPIPVGKWAYWSFALPCKGVQLLIQLRANNSANPGAAPLLVVRYGTLPLQVDGTYTFADYYNGQKSHTLPQAISLTDCVAGKCVVNPLYDDKMAVIGTAQNIGWEVTPPGVYYIGIYNDAQLAKAPLSRYAVSVRILENCLQECGNGFVGIDCQLCPGMLPGQGFVQGDPCTNRGKCVSVRTSHDTYYAKCLCDPDFAGPSCALECSNKDGVVGCSGNGKCVTDKQGSVYCECDPNFKGSDCSLSCPGLTANNSVCNNRGQCGVSSHGAHCTCAPGFAGVGCEVECPDRCGGAGVCILDEPEDPDLMDVQRFVPPNISRGRCSCLSGFTGRTCGIVCPLGVNNLSCSGWGECEEERGRGVCKCHECCEDRACSTFRLRSTSDLSLLTILATVAACLFCLGLFTAIGVLTYRRRRGKFVHFIPAKKPPKTRMIPIGDVVSPRTIAANTLSPQRGPEVVPSEKKSAEDTEARQALRAFVADIDPESPSSPSTARGPDEQSVSFHLDSLKYGVKP